MTEPFAKVSLDAIYAAVVDTKNTLLQMVGHLDSAKQDIADLKSSDSDKEARLRIIEQRHVISPKEMWSAVSVLAAILTAVGTIVALVVR